MRRTANVSVRRARGRARERESGEREENSHARRGDAQHACRPGRAATFNVIMACSMRSSAHYTAR